MGRKQLFLPPFCQICRETKIVHFCLVIFPNDDARFYFGIFVLPLVLVEFYLTSFLGLTCAAESSVGRSILRNPPLTMPVSFMQ